MQLMISGVHIDIGDAFQDYIRDAIENVNEKHSLNPVEVTVQVFKENYQFRSDISSHSGRGVIIRGHGYGPDAYTAFDNAVHHLTERLRRHKKRLAEHHKKQGSRRNPVAPYYILGVEEPSEPENTAELAPPIIAEMEAEIPTLSVGEAVMRLDLSQQTAMLFYNQMHGGLNMVYLRKDGNIGWVDPSNSSEK